MFYLSAKLSIKQLVFRSLFVWALLWSQIGSLALAEPLTDQTVLSFNIRYSAASDGANNWLHRRDLVSETIAQHNPVIFCVQECLADQAAWLRDSFPGYQFTGAGRNDGQQSGEMCAIFVERDRYQVIDHGVFWLSESPDIPGSKSWDAALPRIATWVELQDRRQESQTLFVVNVHFDHKGRLAREKSAGILSRRISALAGDNPVILMGDFNDPASVNTPSYNALVNTDKNDGLVLRDSWHQASREQRMQGEGTFHGFSGEATRGRIDWILVSSALSVVDSGIDRRQWEGRYPSDHFAVWAVLSSRPALSDPNSPLGLD